MRWFAALLLATAPGWAVGCAGGGGAGSEMAGEVAIGLVTLQGGTITELKERRGRGPFRRYELPPDALLDVVAEAAGRARGRDGRSIETIWVRRRSMEIVAKEPAPDAKGQGYAEPWRSAMVAMVHPVVGEPAASRLEIHAMNRGPFHRGSVDWERSLPRWIDDVLRAPRRTPGGLKPLP